jgi:hypothetical protein
MASIDSVVPLLKEILSRISLLEGKVGSGTNVVEAVSGSSSEQPPSIERFDKYTSENLDPFFVACTKLGGDAFLVGTVIKEAWSEMRKILVLASNCKEPPQAGLPVLLAGVSSKIKECSKLINRNEWEKHTKTCSEGISSLNWSVIKKTILLFSKLFILGWLLNQHLAILLKVLSEDQIIGPTIFARNFET